MLVVCCKWIIPVKKKTERNLVVAPSAESGACVDTGTGSGFDWKSYGKTAFLFSNL